MKDSQLYCPVCGVTIRRNHKCHASELAYPPLEGEEAAAAAREVLRVLHESRRPSGTPSEPVQPRMTFGSEGL